MTTTSPPTDIDRYLDEVRRRLDDLPTDERDELLDDLEAHLTEIADEHDGNLTSVLGAPADYAAELRATAGLDTGPRPSPAARWAARWRTVRERMASHRSIAAVLEFLPHLRPAWWVLRAVLVVLVATVVTSDRQLAPVVAPPLLDSRLVGVAALAVAIPLSVRLGRRPSSSTRWRRGVLVGNAAIAVVGSGVYLVASERQTVHHGTVVAYEQSWPSGVTGPDGPITNLYPYDAEGRLLDTVLLYDQDGRPVDVAGRAELYSQHGLPIETTWRVDTNGAPVVNAYPLRQQSWDPAGGPDAPQPLAPPAVVVPRLDPDRSDGGDRAGPVRPDEPSGVGVR